MYSRIFLSLDQNVYPNIDRFIDLLKGLACTLYFKFEIEVKYWLIIAFSMKTLFYAFSLICQTILYLEMIHEKNLILDY